MTKSFGNYRGGRVKVSAESDVDVCVKLLATDGDNFSLQYHLPNIFQKRRSPPRIGTFSSLDDAEEQISRSMQLELSRQLYGSDPLPEDFIVYKECTIDHPLVDDKVFQEIALRRPLADVYKVCNSLVNDAVYKVVGRCTIDEGHLETQVIESQEGDFFVPIVKYPEDKSEAYIVKSSDEALGDRYFLVKHKDKVTFVEEYRPYDDGTLDETDLETRNFSPLERVLGLDV